jgi:hypothetical protein
MLAFLAFLCALFAQFLWHLASRQKLEVEGAQYVLTKERRGLQWLGAKSGGLDGDAKADV